MNEKKYEKYAKMMEDFRKFHSGNHTTNRREIENSAQRRALSGIRKMTLKRLGQANK